MLKVVNLRRVYVSGKNQSPVVALQGISLQFPETGMVFVLGKSGSGKSTLLHLIGGLDRPDEGDIIVDGKSTKSFTPEEMDAYRNTYLGFIFQDYNLLPDFSVQENVALALKLQKPENARKEVEDILQEVGLEGYSDRKPNELSGGQKQRVAIARALVKKPRIILADEPTGALDSSTGEQVFQLLKELSKTRLILVVTHDRDFAQRFGDRIIELKDGAVLSDCSKAPNPDGAGSKVSSFVPTVTDEATEEKPHLQLIPSRFSLTDSIRMGFHSLKVKPFRLIGTILLSTVSFSLFGVAVSFSRFNKTSAMVQSAQANQIQFTFLKKEIKDDRGYFFSDRQVQEAEKETGAASFPVVSVGGELMTLSQFSSGDVYHVRSLESGVMINRENLNAFGFALEAGRLPEHPDECAITEYQYETFADYGYSDDNRCSIPADQVTPEAILGKKVKANFDSRHFPYSQRFLTVTGIVDTHFPKRLEEYRHTSNLLKNYSKEYQELTSESPSMHRLLFLSPDLIPERGYSLGPAQLLTSPEEQSGISVAAAYLSSHPYAFYFDASETDIKDRQVLLSADEYLRYLSKKKESRKSGASFMASFPEAYLSLDSTQGIYQKDISSLSEYQEACLTAAQNKVATQDFRSFFEEDPDQLVQAVNEGTDGIDSDSAPKYGRKDDGSYDYNSLTDSEKRDILFRYLQHYLIDHVLDASSLYATHFEEAYDYYLGEFLSQAPATTESSIDFLTKEGVRARERDIARNRESFLRDYSESRVYQNRKRLQDEGQSSPRIAEIRAIYDCLSPSNTFDSVDFSPYLEETQEAASQRKCDWAKKLPASLFPTLEAVFWSQGGYLQKLQGEDAVFTIVGIDFLDSVSNFFFSSDQAPVLLEYYQTYGGGGYPALLSFFSSDRAVQTKFFSLYNQKADLLSSYEKAAVGTWCYQSYDPEIRAVSETAEVLSKLAQLFLWVGLALALFSLLLFYSFLSASIHNKRHEIGILRALGARKKDVFAIFYFESFWIALMDFLLSSLVTGILIVVISHVWKQKMSLSFNLLSLDPLIFLLLFALALLSSLLASLIPVLKIANEKPVDAIADR